MHGSERKLAPVLFVRNAEQRITPMPTVLSGATARGWRVQQLRWKWCGNVLECGGQHRFG